MRRFGKTIQRKKLGTAHFKKTYTEDFGLKDTDKESYGVRITASDYGRKKETVHKTKHATQDKTKPYWCRNCFCRVKLSDKKCPQCEATIVKPLATNPKGVKY